MNKGLEYASKDKRYVVENASVNYFCRFSVKMPEHLPLAGFNASGDLQRAAERMNNRLLGLNCFEFRGFFKPHH
jgi:hypothetical protein